MAVSAPGYCDRIRQPPKYLNRIELWRCNMNGTGDASGGSIDLACYLPTGFNENDLKIFPRGLHWVLEQVSYGSSVAANLSLVIVIGNILEDYTVTSGKSGIIGGFAVNAGSLGAYCPFGQYLILPFYLGARRVWSLDSPLLVFRTTNTDTKTFDATIWISCWNGVPEDIFTGRYHLRGG